MEKILYYLFLLFIFLFGASIGSFLNCLIYRLHHKRTILGRSFCPHCSHQLSWYDLFPFLSFFILRCRCRYCGQKISWQYPLVELIAGLLFLLAFLNLANQFLNAGLQFSIFNFSAQGGLALGWQFSITLLRDWFFISTMIFVFIYDLKYMLIEDIIVLPAIFVILLLNILSKISFSSILLGAIIGWGIFFFQYFLTKKKGIGEGDLRLGILIGVMFAWPKVLIAIFLSYMIGSFISLFLILFRKKGFKSEIPFGPFLALGSLGAMFWGDKILEFY